MVGNVAILCHWIRYYFNEGLEHSEILKFLQKYHPTIISKSTLLRRLKDYGLSRRTRKILSLETIREARERIHPLIEGPASSSGYRSVWHSLKMTGFHVQRYTIQTLLRDINPEGTESRRRHRLRRRVYSNPDLNYAWHIDGHAKLKPFGFSVHGAIDGYSRKVLWLKVLRSNNSPSVIGGICLDCVKEMEGCPIKLVTDLGAENVLAAAMQTFFRQDIDGHQYIPSPRNQRIESWWSFFTKTMGNW